MNLKVITKTDKILIADKFIRTNNKLKLISGK